MQLQLSLGDILTLVSILAVVVLVFVLFQLIFVVANLRKITTRVDDLTKEIEAVILKPIALADTALEWVVGFLQGWKEGEHEKKHGHNKKKGFVDTEIGE